MEIPEYLDKMKSIQLSLLEYIEKNEDAEEYFENLLHLLNNHQILKNRYDLKSFIYLIISIANNHYHAPNFFYKIEKLIKFCSSSMINYFSNSELIRLFKSNKKILLFLIDESIVMLNKSVFNFRDIETKEFNDKMKIGENDNFICQLIRNDSIEEFIIYLNKNQISKNSIIEPSIYETNQFLIKNQKTTTLIEYAAFFGSIQIFRYLHLNKANITESLWLYAIHSDNPELINYLEENEIEPEDISYEECLKESIKCHHIDLTNYIKNNLLNLEKKSLSNPAIKIATPPFMYKIIKNQKINDGDINEYCFKYYNFINFPEYFDDRIFFNYFCKYDYFYLFLFYLKNKMMNKKEILNSALYNAAMKNNQDIMNLLFERPEIEIGLRFFENCFDLYEIKIPQTINYIGQFAFYQCYSLTSVILPSSLESIENYTFYRCRSLKHIIIPSSVKEIGSCAFSECFSLKEITIPSSVTELGFSVFNKCYSLEKITINSKITVIHKYFFANCKSLKEITIPSSVNLIENNAFEGCSSLKEINILSNLKTIEKFAFKNCSSLTYIKLPSSVSFIGDHCFDGCTSLEKITIPYLIKRIENGTFYNCSSLCKVSFESNSSLTEIEKNAFFECSSLNQFVFPPSLKIVKDFSFDGCTSLNKIFFLSSETLIEKCAFDRCPLLKFEFIPPFIKPLIKEVPHHNLVFV